MPQCHSLKMQHLPYQYFCNLVSNNAFTPPNPKLKDASSMTALLLIFTTSTDLMSIEYVHIDLVVCWAKNPLYKAKSILDYIKYIKEDCQSARLEVTMEGSEPRVHSCMFLYNFNGMMATKMDPPYCLVYPIIFEPSVPQEGHNHYSSKGAPCRVQIHKCICHTLLHHIELVYDHGQKHHEGHLVIPYRAQYNCLLPEVVIPHNH